MSSSRVLRASAIAGAMAITLGAVSLQGQSPNENTPARAVSAETSQASQGTAFTALARVNAAPMTSEELKVVKGAHVHFFIPQAQNDQYAPLPTGFHFAGNPFGHNWEHLEGATDPDPVAPSYNGLCKASTGPGPILIPLMPGAGTQCP